MTKDNNPPRQMATMPNAIHFGLRRPGSRGTVATAEPAPVGGSGARADGPPCASVFRGSMSMLMVSSQLGGSPHGGVSSGLARRDDVGLSRAVGAYAFDTDD